MVRKPRHNEEFSSQLIRVDVGPGTATGSIRRRARYRFADWTRRLRSRHGGVELPTRRRRRRRRQTRVGLPASGRITRSAERIRRQTGADLGIFSVFGQTGPPQREPPTGQRMSDSSATFYGLLGPLYGVLRHLRVSLVQHDILWLVALCTPYCEI